VLQRSPPLVESVRRGDLDLAVILATTPDAPGTRVGAMRLRWMADAGSAGEALGAAGPGRCPAAGYGMLPLVALEEPCSIRARAFNLLGAAGIGASVVAQSATLAGVLSAVRAGLGLALLPVAADVPAGLREMPGLPPAGTIGVHLVSGERVADTITHASVTMLGSFLAGPVPVSRLPASPLPLSFPAG
jgi:DNA-binding transcriptional LysR family regulator